MRYIYGFIFTLFLISNSAMAQSGEQHCIGRFSLTAPPGWEVAGRTQKMYLTELVDDLPAYIAENQDRDRITPVMRNGASAESRPFIRTFGVGDNKGLAKTFGYGDVHSANLQLSVLMGPPDSPLLMVILVSAGNEDKIGNILATKIATGYKPGARTGFCLTHGAMTLEPSSNETVSLTLTNSAFPDASIRLSTQTISKSRRDGPLMDIAGDIRAMRGTGTTLTSLGEHSRKVAGRKGHDGRTQMTEPGKEPVLVYRYFDGGVAGDQTAPEMIISLDGPASNREGLEFCVGRRS